MLDRTTTSKRYENTHTETFSSGFGFYIGREEERAEIERKIDMMTEDELKKWCKDNLYFEDDDNINCWTIDAEASIGKEVTTNVD